MSDDLDETHHCPFDSCKTKEDFALVLGGMDEIQALHVIKDRDDDDVLVCGCCAQGCPVNPQTLRPMRLGRPGAEKLFDEENEWFRRSGWL